MKIGVMLPNWIGDLAMATPALRALRNHFADAEITGIIRPYATSVLEGTNWLDRTLLWEHRGRSPSWVGRWATAIGDLRRSQFDILLLLRNSFFTGLTASLAGAKRTIGFQHNARGWLLTDPVAPPNGGDRSIPISAVDWYLELTYALGCPRESRQLELRTLDRDDDAADVVWRRLRLPHGDRVVMLNTGGAYGAAKHWPTESYVQLARRIVDELGLHVLVNCGPRERDTAAAIERACSHPHIRSLADERDLPLGLTKACIERSRLLVTTDSGPRHLAAGLGTPVVALFGPIDPRWSENYQPSEIQLQLDLPCSPCGRRICPLGHHRCMRDMTVARVFQAVERQLQRSLAPAA